MRWFFWASLAVVVYGYAGYPALVWLLARVRRRTGPPQAEPPAVTLIIPAYNEATAIRGKLENVLALDYPRDRLEVLVVSDGSTDGTDEIVTAFADRGITLIRQQPRAGKTATENLAAARARGEVLVFSDATTIYRPDAVRMLVRHFADPQVGCVGGEERFVQDASNPLSARMGLFWRFERFLRRHESAAGTLIGVSGCIFAVRRTLYEPLDRNWCEDLMVPLRVVGAGGRVVYEPEAVGYEEAPPGMRAEFARKARVVAIGMATLAAMSHLLNPLRHGWVSIQLLSHKVVRWLSPLALAVLFAASAALAGESFYRVLFFAQTLLYAAAVAGWWMPHRGVIGRVVGLPYHFCVANAAAVVGAVRFLTGQRGTLWNPVR